MQTRRNLTLAAALAGALVTSAAAAVAQNTPGSAHAYAADIYGTIVTQGNPTNTAPDAPGNPDNPRFLAGSQYNGVVSLFINTPQGNFGCSGSLINARQILTAAHCVTNGNGDPTINANYVNVRFSQNGTVLATQIQLQTSGVAVHPNYKGLVVDNNDVAILTMPQDAPAGYTFVPLYQGTAASVLNQTITFTGFGTTGTGATGDAQPGYSFRRRVGFNRFEATCNAIGTTPGTNDCQFTGQTVAGTGPDATGGVWNSDFDSGNYANNSLGQIYGCTAAQNTGVCNYTGPTSDILDEVGIGRGDSGGPALLNGAIVGVASWGTSGSSNLTFNSQFGSFGAFYGHTNILTASNRAFINAQIAALVPEPSTYALLATGLLGTGVLARRRRRQG